MTRTLTFLASGISLAFLAVAAEANPAATAAQAAAEAAPQGLVQTVASKKPAARKRMSVRRVVTTRRLPTRTYYIGGARVTETIVGCY